MNTKFIFWPAALGVMIARGLSNTKILRPLLIILFTLISAGCAVPTSSVSGEAPQATFAAPASDPPVSPATATPIPDPPVNNQPVANAALYSYGEAKVDQVEISLLESLPVQVNVVARGSLPDSCTTIDQALVERNDHTFQVQLTTRWPNDRMCTQALVPYENVISLDVAGLPPGQYTVNINGATNTFALPVANATPQVATPATVEPAPSPQPTDQAEGIGHVQIFLVALGDNGQSGQKIGCDDSLIPVEREITPTIAPLRAALNELLSLRDQTYGQSGFYNALYQSDLQAGDIVIDSTGKAIIHLSGQYTLGGVCDIPRFRAQLEATALQFSTVNQVAVFINDQAIQEALSLSE